MDPAQRTSITRELHDVIAHSISIVSVQAAAADAYLERDPAQAREHLAAARRTAHDALAEMRRLAGILRADTPLLLPQPTLCRIGELLAEARGAGIEISLVEEGRQPDIAPGLGLAAFRILQEALANIRRHAGAVAATVRIGYRPDAIELEVTNAVGRRRGLPGHGRGIQAMVDRARLYGGSIHAGFEPDGRFAVRARLPL